MNSIERRVRVALIEIARSRRGFIYYQELCDQCQLNLDMRDNPEHRKEIGRILGNISRFEHEADRPLLSAIVISKSGDEGDGFFKLAEELGRIRNWRRIKMDGRFSAEEMQKCHDYWSNEANYLANK